ncbi:MAG: 2'-5' RNA ligase family protein [Flavisolibacter sp.]
MKSVNHPAGQLAAFSEYILVAPPDEELRGLLSLEKSDFEKVHGYDLHAEPAAGIVLAHFFVKEEMEETLGRWMQNICHLHNSFEVRLNNFSGFPPHAIYIRVQDPLPFRKLTKALSILDGFIQSSDCPPLQAVPIPHLPLAGGLPEGIYEKALPLYARRSFHAVFKVEKLLLLKKEDPCQYQLVNSFVLPAISMG